MPGLSPLPRGNLFQALQAVVNLGPIPAPAGQPARLSRASRCRGAYPRSRGATSTQRVFDAVRDGLSPLPRGNRLDDGFRQPDVGPIPAPAGQPRLTWRVIAPLRAYPRSRGATRRALQAEQQVEGLSPLPRGNRYAARTPVVFRGPIPAPAGQPPRTILRLSANWAYPRSRGATCERIPWAMYGTGLSPLPRGNLALPALEMMGVGPIPAPAGQPLALNLLSCKRNSRNGCEILRSFFGHWNAAAHQPHAVGFHQFAWRVAQMCYSHSPHGV